MPREQTSMKCATMEKAREPDFKPDDPMLAIFDDFTVKSLRGQAINYDFVTKILQRPRYSE